MAFKRYVCWEAQQVHQILNPDAEYVSDEVFLAVHSEHPVWMVDPSGLNTRWSQTAQRFLEQFLDAGRTHVQAAVIGGSGSGKSHLIHWMGLHIPHRESQFVLSIPRSGTSLRGILESIIQVMPPERQRKYREQLDMTGYYSEDHAQRRERLLSEIALAIRGDHPRSDTLEPETERWLIENLPHLFNDPYYRQQYVPERAAIIDELVSHVTETPHEYRRVNKRRLFRVEDLPSSGVSISQMSAVARDFFRSLFYAPELLAAAVEIINRNLDTAIGRMLNFTGDQLIQLMQDVRRSLHKEGKSLVLLIEDFARMQGIDTPLLQALIEAPGTGQGRLCELRWAMAVTTGYYERLPNTVQTRMDFVVNMNPPTEGDAALIHDADVVAFAARYLNAVRLGATRLKEWHNGARDSTRVSLPNRCQSCEQCDTCHSAFGQMNGVGLYPFTSRALLNMTRLKGVMQHGFNPRRLIKDVLAEVLDAHSHELTEGAFPSTTLRTKMVERGSGLTPAQVEQLKRSAPEHYERQRTVLELWGSVDKLSRVPEGVYEAFDLPVPRLGESGAQGAAASEEDKSDSSQTDSMGTDPSILAVRNWANGASMPERYLDKLRGAVWEAVIAYVDWDTCGLEKAYFTERHSGHFRERFVTFRNQQTTFSRGAVNLVIPLTDDPDDLRNSALALEGLLQFEHEHRWSFADGEQCLVALGECLERWSADVLEQLRRLPDGESYWSPVRMSVELLAIGAALGGCLNQPALTPGQQLNALFIEWPAEAPAQSQQWRALYTKIAAQKETLTRVLRARASSTKGGAVRGFVDAEALIRPLLEIAESWQPTALPPRAAERLRRPYDQIVALHGQAKGQLSAVVRAEVDARVAWMERVLQEIAPDTEQSVLIEALRSTREAAVHVGLKVDSRVVVSFDTSRSEFERIDFAGVLSKALMLSNNDPGLGLLPKLTSSTALQAMTSTDTFLKAAAALLSSIRRAVQLEMQSLERHDQGSVPAVQKRIRVSLEELKQLLAVVGGGTGVTE